MPNTSIQVTIILQGCLDPRWADWFSGLHPSTTTQGDTCLRGSLPDHPALHGILERIRDLNLKLVSVQVEPQYFDNTPGETQ